MEEPTLESRAAEVAALCKMAGFAPEAQHQAFLDGVFAVTPEGKVAHPRFEVCADHATRQGVFQRSVLGWLYLSDRELVLWTTDTWTVARNQFSTLADVVHESVLLRSCVARMRRANGEEELRLVNGSRLLMRARGHGARGLAASRLIIDRADTLTDRDASVLLPVMAGQPDSQVILGYPERTGEQ